MFRNILTGAAVIALISGATAQQKQQMNVQKASVNPTFAGVYHPSTGLVSGNGNTAKSGPDELYNNNALSNYYSIPGTDQEWVDNGLLADRNHDSAEQINGFNFTYCSAAANSVDNVIRFYDESVYCGGPTNWPTADCSYDIPGLPGGSNGNLACWIVTMDLCGGFECDLTTTAAQNRSFGWSSTWNDASTGPWIADGGAGQTDSFTWWDTNAANANSGYQGCFWFGGIPWAGFAMAAVGNPVETTSYSSAGGPGADDSLCLSMDVSAQGGATVNLTVSDAAGVAVASTWFASATATDISLMGPFGIDAHLLSNYGTKAFESVSATGVHTLTVPGGAGGGMTWYSQGATLDAAGAPTAMSNGLAHYIF
jgi:hypothetical protein